MKIRTVVDRRYGVNCYIVSDEKQKVCAVIDPASPEISACLEALELRPICILLTHGHFDHVSYLDDIAERYNVPVYIHKNDEELLYDGAKNASVFFEGMPSVSKVRVQTLDNGDKIDIGTVCLEVLNTPGHTKGCVCYFCDDVVFTGDTIFANGYGRTDLYGGDHTQMVQTIQALLPKLSGKTIYPGHGATRKF